MKSEVSTLFAAFLGLACSAGGAGGDNNRGSGSGSGSGGSGAGINVGSGGSGAGVNIGGVNGGGAPPAIDNPATCAEAAMAHSYVGCEFWPTITANPVYIEFDPAVIIANGGTVDAHVIVEGAGFLQEVTVPPGGLQTVLLKWVMGLKGPEFSLANTSGGRLEQSGRVDDGAYRVSSDVPVSAWQFNPLQYRKSGADCPRI